MSTGIVIKNMNGYFYIQDEFGTIHECKVRGRIKKSKYSLLVGDRVEFSEDGFVETI
ncbi:MAG: ribosome small subunit-dependent GTPase A, partial [Veillonella sp.]|nr:ribosome small subunit-dependent GTPase A [Veillonella sp.]